VVYLARAGFRVSGFDQAPEGVRLAREWLSRERLKADLRVQSMFEPFHYTDKAFDAVVCVKTLNHGRIEEIRRAISEIARVLEPGGLLWLVVSKGNKLTARTIHRQKPQPIVIDERTLMVTVGRETGIVHYMFNKAILLREFAGFKILDFHRSGEKDYSMLGALKE
jgi:ubiquinone/menaquinone biosynthesis C-methylase UbiE